MLTLVLALTALVLGSHVTVPLELGRREIPSPELARRWALSAAPALVTAALAVLLVLRQLGIDGVAPFPDAGWLLARSRLAAVLAGGLLLCDLAVLLAWPRFVRAAWRLAAVLGALTLVGLCSVAVSVDELRPRALEPVRAELDEGRWIETASVSSAPPARTLGRIAALCLLALGAGALPVAGRWSRRGRRVAGGVGAAGVLLLLMVARPEIRPLLIAGRDHWTAVAAAVLFALQGWLGPRLASLAGGLALLLAAAVLARFLVLGT